MSQIMGPAHCRKHAPSTWSGPRTCFTTGAQNTSYHMGPEHSLEYERAHGAARFRGASCAASSGACRRTCSGLMLWDVVASHIQSQRGAARIHSAIVFRRGGPRIRPTTWGSARLTTSASNTSDNIGPRHSSRHGPRRITARNMGPDHVLQCRH